MTSCFLFNILLVDTVGIYWYSSVIMKRNGFTLIELVFVIAIVGLMLSIAFPNFSAVQTKAKDTSLKSLSHTLQVAVESFYLTNGSYPSGTLDLLSLVSLLNTNGVVTAIPKNPFTGAPYTAADTSGKILYNYDQTQNLYTITAYGENNSRVVTTIQNQ